MNSCKIISLKLTKNNFCMKHGGSISTAEPQLHGIEKLKPIVKVTPSDESVAMLYLICEKLGFRSSTLPDTRASNKPAQYRLSVDYAEGLQDLISLLSAEEGKLLVKLYEMQLMERHLLPMLHVFSQRDGALTKDFTSIIALFELCLLFTKDNILASQAPPELLFDHRLRVKRLFEDEQFFSAILTLVVSSIDGMKQSRFPDQMVFELMKRSFLLVKQIVLIPDSNVLTGDFGRQSRVMRALCESKLMNFIAIASASLRHPSDGKLFSPHAANFVDILNALYSSIDPDAVALILTSVPGNSKSIESVLRDDEIRTIRKPIRHSRFSGSLSVKLATGEEYVLPASYMSKSDSSTGPQQLIKRSQSIRRKTGDGFLPIGVASNDDLRTYGHAAIQLLMSGAINELITISGNIIVVDQVTDDSLSIALMGLMTWFLRFSRTIGNQKIKKNSSSHGENNSDPFSMEFIMAALHPELVMTFSSNMRRDAYDRSKLRVLLSNIRYHREVLRAAEAIARVGYADCNTEYLLEYACKPSFAVSLRTILTGPCSARLSVKALSVAIEAIYVLIRLLRIVTDCSSLKNRNFMDFSCFIDSLACEVVVDALTRILTDSHLFNPASNRYLGSLIGKLARVNGGRFIFRISFIESLHSVIYDTNAAWKRLNQDLLNICFSVVSLFVDAVRKDPMEMIRIFFHVPSTLLKTARGLEKVISDSSLEKVEESYDLEERKDDSLDRIANWSLEEQIRWLVRQLFEDEDCSSTLSFVVSCIASFSTQNHHVFEISAQSRTQKLAMCTGKFKKLLELMGFERAAFGFHFIWKIENSDTNSDSNDSQRSHQSFHERVEILQTALRDALSSASDANQSILRLGAPKPMLENDTVFGSEKVAKKRLKKNSFDRNAERKKSSQPKRLKLKDEEFSDSNRNEPLGKLVDNSENYLTPNCIDSSDMTTSDAESFSFERNDIYDSLESSIKIGNILYPDDLPSVSEFKKKSFSEINIGEEETQCNQRPSVADSEHFEFKKPSKIRCTLIMSDDD